MSLFATPEIHAANGPETWTVRKVEGGRGWLIETQIVVEEGYMKGSLVAMGWQYSTKREATADIQPDGRWGRLYAQESDWYAGGKGAPGWRPYSVVKAENEAAAKKREEAKRAEERKTERMGVTIETLKEWEDATAQTTRAVQDDLDSVSELTDALEVAEEAMRAMLELLQGQTLLDPDELKADEAKALVTELTEVHDLGSGGWVGHYIDRIKYHGLDANRPALEILEEIERAA